MESKREYEVGYGKPPKHSRFCKGQSGNPQGRPKGSKNLATLLDQALDEPVIVNEYGQRRQVSKREAVLKQLVNKAASGDLKSMHLLLATMRVIDARQEPGVQPQPLSEEDEKIMVQLSERIRRWTQTPEKGV
jgi:Family of unknown function (DUF5681)